MSVYDEAGLLILGTRLKRISDRFLNEVTKVYKKQHICFETVWFPVLFLLDKRGSMSLTEISNELEVSHSAVSQMINQLQGKKIVDIQQDKSDARIKRIILTARGRKLIEQVRPVWHALSKSFHRILPEKMDHVEFLKVLTFIEKQLNQNILSKTTLDYLIHEPGDVIISEPGSKFREKLIGWLDQEGVLYTPSEERYITALSGDSLVGMCAFKPDKDYISIKYLYVTPNQRRKGVGLRLIRSISKKYGIGSSGWFQLDETNIDLIKVLIKSGYSFKVK